MNLRRLGEVEAAPWKNGGGVTRELWREPAVGEFRLRVSVAEVGAAGPFSRFDGVERVITLLHGAGFRLRGPGWTVDLRPGSGAFRFKGDEPVECTLLDGPIADVNVMWTRALGSFVVRRRRSGGVAAGSVIVGLGRREVGVADARAWLQAGDLLALGPDEPARLLAGSAPALVVAPG